MKQHYGEISASFKWKKLIIHALHFIFVCYPAATSDIFACLVDLLCTDHAANDLELIYYNCLHFPIHCTKSHKNISINFHIIYFSFCRYHQYLLPGWITNKHTHTYTHGSTLLASQPHTHTHLYSVVIINHLLLVCYWNHRCRLIEPSSVSVPAVTDLCWLSCWLGWRQSNSWSQNMTDWSFLRRRNWPLTITLIQPLAHTIILWTKHTVQTYIQIDCC